MLVLLAVSVATASTDWSAESVIGGAHAGFKWKLPASWEQTKPKTTAQYAVQVKGSRGEFNCSLHIQPVTFSIQTMSAEYKKTPRRFFEDAVLSRVPNSQFISSSPAILGNQEAFLTEYVCTAEGNGKSISWAGSSLNSVHNGKFYTLTFECPLNSADFGRVMFQRLIENFAFVVDPVGEMLGNMSAEHAPSNPSKK